MGRPRKFKTPDELHSAWETYKAYCDSKPVLTHAFNSKTGEFVSAELKHSVTYTIEGFCVYVGISRQAFHEYYAESKRFVDIVTRMREECETDAREKFEVGAIPRAVDVEVRVYHQAGSRCGSQALRKTLRYSFPAGR